MSGTPNPNSDIGFGDGNTAPLPNLADEVILFIGCATSGPYNRARLASAMASVLRFGHGPLVGEGSHHVNFGQPFYMMRGRRSIVGTFSSVVKTAVGSSTGTATTSPSSFSVHGTVLSNGAPMDIRSGWILPPAPLQLQLVSGAATVAHTRTLTYLDQGGDTRTETLSITGPGTVLTTGEVRQVIRDVSSVDPVGPQSWLVAFDGPQDRYDVVWRWSAGGQLTGGYRQPVGQWSADNGRTWSRSVTLPTTGIVDLYSYAGGLIPQATGMRLTFAGGSPTAVEYGSLRTAAGPDINADIVWTALKSGVTIAHNNGGGALLQPISFTVVGDAVTLNYATDGAGACTVASAQDYLNFLATDPGAGTVAARARLRGRPVGTGASKLTTNVGTTAFTNGSITWTARQEGVRIQVIERGISQTRKIDVVSGDVIAYLDTDANGVRTTTAQQLVDMVAGHARASLLLSGLPGGTGAGLAGDTVGFISLPVAFETGDTFSFTTTPPLMGNADIAESLEALRRDDRVLNNISAVRIVKDGADGADFNTLETSLGVLGDSKRQFLFGIISSAYCGSTDPDVWADNVLATYNQRGTRVSIVAGEVDTQLPAYGSESRRNFASLYTARLMSCPLSELPSHVECDTLRGIRYALAGVGGHLVPGGDPTMPEYDAMYQDEDVLVRLHAANIVTPRKWPKLTGVYVRQGLVFTEDGSDWTFITNRRIGNVAAALAYIETLRKVNGELLTDPITGRLAESEHQAIESTVYSYVAAKLLDDDGRRHVTAIEVISDRNIDFSRTFSVFLALNIVGRSPAVRFSTTINVTRTLRRASSPI